MVWRGGWSRVKCGRQVFKRREMCHSRRRGVVGVEYFVVERALVVTKGACAGTYWRR